jgi:hypothetical protein
VTKTASCERQSAKKKAYKTTKSVRLPFKKQQFPLTFSMFKKLFFEMLTIAQKIILAPCAMRLVRQLSGTRELILQ